MFSRARVFLAATVLLTAVACSEDEPIGTLTDPAGLAADVSAIDSIFDSPVFDAFTAITPRLPGVAAAAGILRPSRALLEQQPGARVALDARALAQLAPMFAAAAPQDSFLPDVALGTYEWDTTTTSYVKTARPGAPANTLRFILYAVNPITDLPVVPLDEVGYADLTDNQTVGPNASLGVVVRDSAGTTTYLDYDLTLALSGTGLTGQAIGFVADGAGARIDFSILAVVTENSSTTLVSLDAQFDVNQPDVTVEVHDRASISGINGNVTITRDFRLARGTESIRVTGTVTIVESPPGTFTITVLVVVRVNGGVFATITGTGTAVTITKADGTPLTAAEQDALRAILAAANDFWDDIESMFEPSELVTS